MNNLLESFYDNVSIPCPRCDGNDVTVYSYLNEANVHIIEGICDACQARWSLS